MNCHATTTSPIPRSHLHALRDPNWHKAMVDEYNALISNETYKARLVMNGRMTLGLGQFFSLDVNNAFLHGQLSETVYMHQPPGFIDSAHPDYVCHLQRSFHKFLLKEISLSAQPHMQHCNPCKTPVDTESKLGSDGDPVSDLTLYRSLAGALQYLTFTRPDISYAVQQISLHA
ncbi:ribonuclease H-like domain-containing protein [Tanacetum coccineum]|uniref:Ribonuclease H-like domain-containing protein n=1 Tax=Tanacetum coccineum TaxID=301880 RepID=A0ABQ5FH17_9ASTR